MSKPGLYTLQVHTSCQVNQSNWYYTYERRLPENVAEATLEVGATTVPSHFLAFMAFLAAFMAFTAFVAFFGAASGAAAFFAFIAFMALAFMAAFIAMA